MYRGKMDGWMSAIPCWGDLRRQLKSPAREMSLRLHVLKLPSLMVQLSLYKTTQLLKWNEMCMQISMLPLFSMIDNSIYISTSFESWSKHQEDFLRKSPQDLHRTSFIYVYASNNSSLFGITKTSKYKLLNWTSLLLYFGPLPNCPQVEYQLANFKAVYRKK